MFLTLLCLCNYHRCLIDFPVFLVSVYLPHFIPFCLLLFPLFSLSQPLLLLMRWSKSSLYIPPYHSLNSNSLRSVPRTLLSLAHLSPLSLLSASRSPTRVTPHLPKPLFLSPPSLPLVNLHIFAWMSPTPLPSHP